MFIFVAQECKRQWANLRDAYRRAIKKSATVSDQKAKYLKKWKYESEMDFLKPYMKERETVSTIEAQNDTEKNSSDSENEETLSQNDTPQSDNNIIENINLPEENIPHSTPTALSPQFTKPQPKKIMTQKKRKKTESHVNSESASSQLMKYIIEKEKEEESKSNEKTNEINVIDQFFQNMSLTVKQFSPYHQHLAKTRVFSVISELELEHIKSQQPPPPQQQQQQQQYQQEYEKQNIGFQSLPQSTQAYTHSPVSHHSDSDTTSSTSLYFQTFT